MNLGIDVSPAVYHRGGIGVYSRSLYNALCDLPQKPNLIPVYNQLPSRGDSAWLRHAPILLPWGNKSWRARVLLAHISGIAQDRQFPAMDTFLATDHLLPNLRAIKQVFVLHDVSFRLTHTASTWNKLFLAAMLPRFLSTADAVIVPSKATFDDAQRLYRVPVGKMHIIPDGVSPEFYPVPPQVRQAIRHKYALPDQFILAVGTVEPRKNYERLLQAYEGLGKLAHDIPLVIAGKPGWRSSSFYQRLSRLGSTGEVRMLDYIPADDLPALYSAATIFVFPSLYEGFGLPPLEAMACGAPVISSNTASLPEVIGDAGILTSPVDTTRLADVMALLLQDAPLRADLREKGLLRARTFTWQRTAEETYAVCRGIGIHIKS